MFLCLFAKTGLLLKRTLLEVREDTSQCDERDAGRTGGMRKRFKWKKSRITIKCLIWILRKPFSVSALERSLPRWLERVRVRLALARAIFHPDSQSTHLTVCRFQLHLLPISPFKTRTPDDYFSFWVLKVSLPSLLQSLHPWRPRHASIFRDCCTYGNRAGGFRSLNLEKGRFISMQEGYFNPRAPEGESRQWGDHCWQIHSAALLYF